MSERGHGHASSPRQDAGGENLVLVMPGRGAGGGRRYHCLTLFEK